eukprot:TRINITY_DN13632_c0_g3_i2.p1 TRINITY_DN13632_c0_g3~~TRINITY_DN13632_c0_g3_i2.p1  ORF type:complete len:373 (+),score=-22.75 TRINITY_DN13632_c0_g3_i2:83-1201(+)
MEARLGRPPLFSFGVMTDVQYADIDDGHSFLGIPRFYRHSLEVVRKAVRDWNHPSRRLSFAVHFGDLVDGYCPRERSEEAFETVLGEFAKFQHGQTFHMIGNHCLYNLPRTSLNRLLHMPPSADHRSYYEFRPFPGFRVVVIDAYDVSLLGWPSGHPHAALAESILATHNPNAEKNSPEGMAGLTRRFLKFNGGGGEEQLTWLEGVLASCDRHRERAIICCHLPIEPNALPTATCLVWNFDKVLATVQRHESAVAVVSGHAHFGAYTCDDTGVHHRILEAALECPPGTSAFGHIDVYSDRLCLIGHDRMMSTQMIFRDCHVTADVDTASSVEEGGCTCGAPGCSHLSRPLFHVNNGWSGSISASQEANEGKN